MQDDYGYDYEPKVGGKYLTLKQKGDSITIRIASKPLHKTIHWVSDQSGKPVQVDCEKQQPDDPCKYCAFAIQKKSNRMKAKELFGWIVLDRVDGNKPKVFKAGTQIYLEIRGLANTKAWGNPLGYDLEITRTEEKPKFYNVIPLPDKSVITPEEKQTIADAGYNLEAELGSQAEPTRTFGEIEDTPPEDEKVDQPEDERPPWDKEEGREEDDGYGAALAGEAAEETSAKPATPEDAERIFNAKPAAPAKPKAAAAKANGGVCENCGRTGLTDTTVEYSKKKFGGAVFCFNCQRNMTPAS